MIEQSPQIVSSDETATTTTTTTTLRGGADTPPDEQTQPGACRGYLRHVLQPLLLLETPPADCLSCNCLQYRRGDFCRALNSAPLVYTCDLPLLRVIRQHLFDITLLFFFFFADDVCLQQKI